MSAEPRLIDLSDEHPEAFQAYVQWLYSNKVALKVVPEDLDDNDNPQYDDTRMHSLIVSYVLGEKLIDTAYQNAIIAVLIRYAHEVGRYPCDNSIKLAYERTTKDSPLRRLLLDFYVWQADESWVDPSVVKNTCIEFATDLIIALLKNRSEPGGCNASPWIKDSQSYKIKDTKDTNKDDSKPEGVTGPSVGLKKT
jgi:hypothetical protein